MRREQRLHRGREFDTAFGEGTVFRGPLLVVRARPNGLGVTRWGFAVGKRMLKRSVDRNRLRRRLREAARQISVAPGYDVIVVARQGAEAAPFVNLRDALEQQLRRAGLLGGSE
jgi:ribonuclease P protein component